MARAEKMALQTELRAWTVRDSAELYNVEGWGRGFFDKTLGSMARRPPAYAVIYDSELVDSVPLDVHDQPVTGVVTPTRTVELPIRS